jgi:hypothetical protein
MTTKIALTALMTLTLSLPTLAGDASTSAGVTQIGSRPGTANATAAYVGDGRGQARTNTRSGPVSLAEGLAFGVDRDGIDFSVSYAVASRFAPALASTFNMSIGRDGSVASSGGLSVANPAPIRSVNAGGFARSQPGGSIAGSTAGGRSDPYGTVKARTWSDSRPPARTNRLR